jgi:hypothetical protein
MGRTYNPRGSRGRNSPGSCKGGSERNAGPLRQDDSPRERSGGLVPPEEGAATSNSFRGPMCQEHVGVAATDVVGSNPTRGATAPIWKSRRACPPSFEPKRNAVSYLTLVYVNSRSPSQSEPSFDITP